MSTIIFDGSIIAIDSMSFVYGNKSTEPSHNFFILSTNVEDENLIVGCVGNRKQYLWFINNINHTSDVNYVEKFRRLFGDNNFLALTYNTSSKDVYIYSGFSCPTLIESEFISIGTGSAFALGAMAAGSDAITAMKIAAAYDVYTDGYNIQYYDINNIGLEVNVQTDH